MGYTKVALEDKILEMYPEIAKNGISVGLVFDEKKNAYIVKFTKDKQELTTHLEKKDADDCMNNVKCVYLGVQVQQFIKNFDLRAKGR
jgi:paraquat-inducible protein B